MPGPGETRLPRVLVTGSNRGIGLELVRQYAGDGYDVIATCRKPEHATELSAVAATAPGGAVTVQRLDVSSEDQLDALAAALGDTPIDILFCNAAVFGGPRSRFPDVDWQAWRNAFDTNVLGAIRVAVRLWPNVAASRERKIVFVSSRAGLPQEAAPNRSYIYGSSKAALNSSARLLALDLASHDVTAVLLNPGHVQTGIGGARAPMTPSESVTRMRAVVRGLTRSHAGKFLHYDGSELKL
jgi:NAD(P)-dependent dehydrogenase (short-subunit alcohol dehydrogenase family)